MEALAHHCGLVFGIITATWAFSGLLSMGPFKFLDRLTGNGRGTFNMANALRGEKPFDLAAFAEKTPRDAIASLGAQFQTRELVFTTFAGESVNMATATARPVSFR